jgi:hypothetical protein
VPVAPGQQNQVTPVTISINGDHFLPTILIWLSVTGKNRVSQTWLQFPASNKAPLEQ